MKRILVIISLLLFAAGALAAEGGSEPVFAADAYSAGLSGGIHPPITLMGDSSGQNAKGVASYSLLNSLVGFGLGSRKQGDAAAAKALLATDITGLSLMAAGGAGLFLSTIVYNFMTALSGDVTKADLYITGAMLGAGAVAFLTGRVVGAIRPVIFRNRNVSAEAHVGLSTSGIKMGIGIWL